MKTVLTRLCASIAAIAVLAGCSAGDDTSKQTSPPTTAVAPPGAAGLAAAAGRDGAHPLTITLGRIKNRDQAKRALSSTARPLVEWLAISRPLIDETPPTGEQCRAQAALASAFGTPEAVADTANGIQDSDTVELAQNFVVAVTQFLHRCVLPEGVEYRQRLAFSWIVWNRRVGEVVS